MKPKILIGTFNIHKVEEIQAMLGETYTCLGCSNFPELSDVEETGLTLAENAILKAEAYFKATGLATLADDSGLEIKALGGKPGVFSARYAGVPTDSAQNKAKVLAEMINITDRTACFRTVIAFCDGKQTLIFEGKIVGKITTEERGTNGFGYDSIFIPDTQTLTFAEMDSSIKNKISHRAQAVQACVAFLKNYAS